VWHTSPTVIIMIGNAATFCTDIPPPYRDTSVNLTMASILVIDDNEPVRGFLRAVLEGQGHTVVEAGQGRSAVQRLRTSPVDLVLTDIYMPDCDGLEVIMTLRRDFPSVRIVAMSGGSGDRNLLVVARQLGAREILEKPINVEELVRTVTAALADQVDRSQ
jgi:CheY-like chemotaxis protein